MGREMMPFLVMALAFLAVVLTVLALAPLFRRKVDLGRRLTRAPEADGRAGAVAGPAGGATLRDDHAASPWARIVAEVESRGLSLDDDKAGFLAEKLSLAGYTRPYAVRVFVLSRTVLTLLLPALVYLAILATGSAPSAMNLYLLIVGSAAAGLYLPNLIVSSRAEANRTEILNGFPDALDLMMVCVEAGLGIDSCFAKVGQELVALHPRLSGLLAGVSLELRAGRARADALKNMAMRSGVDEIRAFATLIVQSDRLGASFGQALKIYAGEMREARRMRAEEKAHRLPVLLSIPLVVFLLPCMVGVIALPTAISLRGTMFGG